MASGRSGGAELPDFGPDNKTHLLRFSKREFGKPKWSGGLFRHSYKDRTDSLLNEFVKENEHRENIFGEFKFIFSCSNICYSYVC